MAARKVDRLAAPMMFAFRSAHEKRDGRTALDLRDSDGERVIAPRRAPSRAPISASGLRREVSGHLGDLLNTVNLGSALDLAEAPEVARSVLNFGLPDLSALTIDEQRLGDISRWIETALATHEPRLAPGALKVGRDPLVEADALKVKFFIKADLRAEPLDVPVEFVAEVELDSGKIKIDRL